MSNILLIKIRKTFRFTVLFCLMISPLNLLSCKKARKEGEAKSVEALLGNTVNEKRRRPEGVFCGQQPNPNESSAQAITRVMGVVPPMLLSMFFTKQEAPGKYRILDGAVKTGTIEEVSRICAEEFGKRVDSLSISTEEKDKIKNGNFKNQILHSCFVLPKEGSKLMYPTIHIIDSPKAIDEELLVMVFYTYFEFYMDIKFNRAARPAVLKEASNFPPPNSTIVASMISMINRTEILRDRLGEAFFRYLQTNPERLKVFVELFRDSETNLTKNPNFKNYVASELLDSYFCSEKTFNSLIAARMDQQIAGKESIVSVLAEFAVQRDEKGILSIGNFLYPWFAQKDYKNPLTF